MVLRQSVSEHNGDPKLEPIMGFHSTSVVGIINAETEDIDMKQKPHVAWRCSRANEPNVLISDG